uniref:Proteasome subunit alpha type n=1 Tax=Steinernema glaseri TaxID=37863 RepID=A0A1I7ZPX1_9BILA
MSSIGTGYDLAASTFSPDGRIFQVEYGQKAVDNSCTVIGMRGKDGVLLIADKPVSSNLYVKTANPRVTIVDQYTGFASSGLYPDCVAMLDYATGESLKHLKDYRSPMPLKKMANAVAEYAHYFTLTVHRPFGSAAFFSSWTKEHGPQLFLVEPSGLCYEYKAWAIGNNRQMVKTEIERMQIQNMSFDELTKEAARIIMILRDESKEKNSRMEMGWVGADTDGKAIMVDDEIVSAAEEWARQKIEEEDLDD